MKLPVLVECKPYTTKLTRDGCVKRWQMARALDPSKPVPKAGNEAIRHGQIKHTAAECYACEVGAERAKEGS